MAVSSVFVTLAFGLTTGFAFAMDISGDRQQAFTHQGQQLIMMNDLPTEIIFRTVEYLDYKNLFKCMAVSREWSALCRAVKAQRLFTFDINHSTHLSSLKGYLEAATAQNLSVCLRLIFKSVKDLEALNLNPTLVKNLQLTTIGHASGFNRQQEVKRAKTFNDEQLVKLMTLSVVSNLSALALPYSSIQCVQPLIDLRKLQSLDLNMSSALKTVAPLSSLTLLRSLNVSGVFRFNCDSISGLVNLEFLKLCGILVGDGKFLKPLTNLKSLNLESSKLTTLENIVHLTSLKTLVLAGVDIKDVSSLAALPGLQELALDVKAKDYNLFVALPEFAGPPMDGIAGLETLMAHNRNLKIIDTSKL